MLIKTLIPILFILTLFMSNCLNSQTMNKFNGPYLGQKLPAKQPKLFAPGFISTQKNEFNATFSPNGKEFYFSIAQGNSEHIYVSKQIKNQWSTPTLVSFSSQFKEADPIFSPDGRRLYFISTRPLTKNRSESKDWDIWYTERNKDGWSSPINLGHPINSQKDEWYVSLTNDNTIYFASNRNGGLGSFDIYSSKLVNHSYLEPINLGNNINSKYLEQDPFISPDESFILFTSVNRPDGYGSGDIYISYRNIKGEWSKANNLGNLINSKYFDYCPILSPDQQYFFYTSKGDIYWIHIDFIKEKLPNN